MTDEHYDVAVLGAGPAGATAAGALAGKGRRVALIDRRSFPRLAICSGWVSARVESVLKSVGMEAGGALKQPFRDVTLYDASFAKSTRPAFAEAPGYLVDRNAFDQSLVQSAARQGATFIDDFSVSDVRLLESSATITADDGRTLTSRLVVIASGRNTRLADQIGFAKPDGGRPAWAAQVVAPVSGKAASKEPRVAIVLGLDGAESFGFCCVGADRVSIDIHWQGEREGVAEAMVNLCRAAHTHAVSPVDLSSAARSAEILRSPAGTALDIDSHVRKHTLLIGDAGGFVSAVSNEGVYPATWSAVIAADVIHAALDCRHSQDALMTFDSRWRVEMADHLRSPHADIRFLLPLIFANQPMADRMGAAFFFGDNI